MRSAIRIAANLAALAALLASSGCAGLPPVDAATPELAGRYEDLTQQEWTLAVELRDDGSARLEYTWWDPRRGAASLRTRDATWERSGANVLLHYDRVTDTLAWRRKLRSEDGRTRGRGFESVPPIDSRSIIGDSRLWQVAASSD